MEIAQCFCGICFQWTTVWSHWCLSPVLNVPQEHQGLYVP